MEISKKHNERMEVRELKRKVVSILLIAGMVAGALAGCGSGGKKEEKPAQETADGSAAVEEQAQEVQEKEPEAEPEPEEADPTAGFEGQEMSFVAFDGGGYSEYWTEIVKRFEEAYGVTVNLEMTPQVNELLQTKFASGDVPDVAVLSYGSAIATAGVEDHALMALTDLYEGPGLEDQTPLKDQVLDGLLDSTPYSPYGDGVPYFAPVTAAPNGLYYNKTLFEQNGWEVPVTWDDFFELGDKAKEKGHALFTFQGIYPGYFDAMIPSQIVSALGVEGLNDLYEYKEGSFNKPEIVEILTNIQKISTGGYMLEGTLSMNHTQAQSEMMMDRALFITCGSYIVGEMADAPRTEGFKFGICAPPVLEEGQMPSVSATVNSLAIPKDAKNPELAIQFLRFVYSEESIKLMADKADAVVAVKQGLTMASDYLSDDLKSIYEIYDVATPFSASWGVKPAGCNVNISNYVYDVLSDVFTEKVSVEEWVEGVEGALTEINSYK